MKKIYIIISSIALLILAGLYIAKSIKEPEFSIDYLICDRNYKDCFVSAKFNDMNSCQRQVVKDNWLCDETDEDNIKCRVNRDSFATAYCKD